MNPAPASDPWQSGSPYERYIGRWSRRIAPLFLDWLDLPAQRRWVDVGCGTGALSAAVMAAAAPDRLVAVDPSEGFLAQARHLVDPRVRWLHGEAASLPLDTGCCDVVVAGLVLNFVPDLPAALAEMARVGVPGATVAAYVWDYAEGMEIIKRFWDVAAELDPAAAPLHEAARFPLCRAPALQAAFERAGFDGVATTSLELTAVFADFDDYWAPFLGGQGPAPAYAMSLPEDRRAALRERLRSRLTPGADGRIALRARAWAVRGRLPSPSQSP